MPRQRKNIRVQIPSSTSTFKRETFHLRLIAGEYASRTGISEAIQMFHKSSFTIMDMEEPGILNSLKIN